MPQTKTFPVHATAAPKALIFWCGDPRIQGAVNQFIKEDLKLADGEYVPITVLGGAASFSEPLSIPKEFKFMRDTAEFTLEHFASIHRVILINHEDCAKYKAMHESLGAMFLRGAKGMSDRQRTDLKKIAAVVLEIAGRHLNAETYLMRYVNPEHSRVVFEPA